MTSGDGESEDFEPSNREIAQLKDYVDERVEQVRESDTERYRGLLESAGFSREEIEKKVDDISSTGVTRRAALGAIVAGVFGVGMLSGEAAAASPGSSGETVWGSASNRLSLYADVVDAKTIDTDKLWNNGDILLKGVSGSLLERRDPANYNNPIDTAVSDLSAAGGGTVQLPAGSTDEPGPVSLKQGVYIKGPHPNVCEINITGNGKGLELNESSTQANIGLDGFSLTSASGVGTANGVPLDFYTEARNVDIGNLRFNGWNGANIRLRNQGYQFTVKRLEFNYADAGGANGLIDLENAGPAINFGQINAYPRSSFSGSNSTILYIGGANTVDVGQMNLGRTLGPALTQTGGGRSTQIGSINYEPTNQVTTPHAIINHTQYNNTHVGVGFINPSKSGCADWAFAINGGGHYLGRVEKKGNLTTGVVTADSDVARPTVYFGGSWDVTNNSGGTLSQPISCLGDLSTVS